MWLMETEWKLTIWQWINAGFFLEQTVAIVDTGGRAHFVQHWIIEYEPN